jgi:hypothetical protein
LAVTKFAEAVFFAIKAGIEAAKMHEKKAAVILLCFTLNFIPPPPKVHNSSPYIITKKRSFVNFLCNLSHRFQNQKLFA